MDVTYEKFLDAFNKSGLYLSDYDMQLAKQNPNAGFGILNAKQDYANATTDEARALANANAEMWRKQNGYSAGADGSGYNPILQQPTGNGMLDSKTMSYMNYPSYQSIAPAPSFNDSYKPQYDQNLQKMLNYQDFSYDYNSDPLYQQYKQAYNREGQRAMQNTLAEISARTGGLASSYAATAAAQANNYYAQQLADKIPDLYQLAYQQYADQYNRMNNNVGALQNARSFDYGTYQDALSQYNADRAFDYGVYSDEFNRLASQIGVLTDQDNTAYTRMQAALKAAGRGSGAETKTVEPISDALASQLMTLSGTDAANALTTYYDRLTESQRNILARRAGVDPFTVKKGLGNAEDTAALLSLIAPQTQNIYDIIDTMKANGASDLEISQVIAGTSGIDQREKAALLSRYIPEYNGKSIPSAR